MLAGSNKKFALEEGPHYFCSTLWWLWNIRNAPKNSPDGRFKAFLCYHI